MNKKTLLTCLVLVFCTTLPGVAQMAKFKALFLYNFAQNIGWPTAEDQSSQFLVTVVGDKEMATELKQLAKVKKIGVKEMVVVETNQVKNIEKSHIIFLGQSKSNLMPDLNNNQKGQPVLIISSKEDLCKQGAGISFVTIDGKLRFQISPTNIESRGLKMAGKLTTLGINVD
jgi:hypothetical protein